MLEKRNWILTNGIGGYSSQENMDNTNKYHGLLIAAMNKPAQRQLILSKIDEKLEFNKTVYDLNDNLTSYNIDNRYVEFNFNLENIKIKKSICMVPGENTVCIRYNIKNYKENIILKLTPIVNFRSFHKNDDVDLKCKQEIKNNQIKLEINDNKSRPVYLFCKGTAYEVNAENFAYDEKLVGSNEIYKNISPGTFSIKINALREKEICFICSEKDYIDGLDYNKIFNDFSYSINNVLLNSKIKLKGSLKKKYFLLKEKCTIKNADDKKVLIAGYPYYLEDGRLLYFSIEGMSLISGDYELAKNSIMSLIRNSKDGFVPNSHSGFDNAAIFDNFENSLMIISSIYKTYQYTKDKFFLNDIYSYMEKIINSYICGIDYDELKIYMNKDYLLVSKDSTKYNAFEKNMHFFFNREESIKFYLNALWYNSLMLMSYFANELHKKDEKDKYLEIASIVKNNFKIHFYDNPDFENITIIDKLIAYSLEYPIFDDKKGIMQLYDEIKNNISKELLEKYPFIIGMQYDLINNILCLTQNKSDKKSLLSELNKINTDAINLLEKEINIIKDDGTFLLTANLAEMFKIINKMEVK